ncbi:T-box transcription factor mls-1-like [Centruroides sculpturatus]|uniref:T-box transcription factor mls-1-like n=1 Tax=Centruroides sculpturatus TaxID=218467 RepID=UPI000C6E50CC|nr:T-box transcription factor mls-1-like [Centruroides sculpturatus]XP_023223097.1 T-box transcription factor mls-1-like [Centruroides sculpturatus]
MAANAVDATRKWWEDLNLPPNVVRNPALISDKLKDARIIFQNKALWERFNELQTEMVVTKIGRRMFPSVSIRLCGLCPNTYYFILLDVIPVDNFRYRYNAGTWTVAGRDPAEILTQFYKHPDSPALGSHWMKDEIFFDKVKLSNGQIEYISPNDSKIVKRISIRSMRKYIVRIHLSAESDIRCLNMRYFKTFCLEETKFIAVTAYHNDQVTQLKISYNPFAKGFREAAFKRGESDGDVYEEAERSIVKVEAGSSTDNETVPQTAVQMPEFENRREISAAEAYSRYQAQQEQENRRVSFFRHPIRWYANMFDEDLLYFPLFAHPSFLSPVFYPNHGIPGAFAFPHQNLNNHYNADYNNRDYRSQNRGGT